MQLAVVKIFRTLVNPTDGITHCPEDYAAAGGELLVLALSISWGLTAIFNPAVIRSNPLQDRVGYNNLCVGWDTPPGKYVAAPIFALIIVTESRFMQLDYWRADLDSRITDVQKIWMGVSHLFNFGSWLLAIGIFSTDAMVAPLGHTISFVQLVVFGYIGYVGNFFATDPKYHKRGSHVFCAIFGVVCAAFGGCALTQMVAYDEVHRRRGPVPPIVMMVLDYGYFVCMAVQGSMRPAAPSLSAKYTLVSDDDFTVVSPGEDSRAGSPGAAHEVDEVLCSPPAQPNTCWGRLLGDPAICKCPAKSMA